MDKTKTVVAERKLLVARDAVVIDSLIDELRPQYGKDTRHYLPLLEQRIQKSSNAAGKYLREFQLFEEAKALRTDKGFLTGEDYEQLLRWYVGKLIYKNNMSDKDKMDAYEALWNVYMVNNANSDSLDLKLLDRYASKCSSAKDYRRQCELLELKRDYIARKQGKTSRDYATSLKSLCLYYSLLYTSLHQGEYVYSDEKRKETECLLELYGLHKQNVGCENVVVKKNHSSNDTIGRV